MKQIEVIETIKKTKFVANDGTVFDCKEECERYDKTALCVIKARLQEVLRKQEVSFDPTEFQYNDQNDGKAIFIKDEKILQIVSQWVAFHGCAPLTEAQLGHLILLESNDYDGYYFWRDLTGLATTLNKAITDYNNI